MVFAGAGCFDFDIEDMSTDDCFEVAVVEAFNFERVAAPVYFLKDFCYFFEVAIDEVG